VDILVLVVLCLVLRNKVKAKGRKPTGYVFLLIGTYFGGAIGGLIFGLIILVVAGGTGEGSELLIIMGFGLGGLIIGAIIPFLVVQNLSQVPDEPALRDFDYDPDWRDREGDFRTPFHTSGPMRDDYQNDPHDRPYRAEDRYRTE
jgi:hypothetical protein